MQKKTTIFVTLLITLGFLLASCSKKCEVSYENPTTGYTSDFCYDTAGYYTYTNSTGSDNTSADVPYRDAGLFEEWCTAEGEEENTTTTFDSGECDSPY